ncbi:MFS transporter [Paenibacillus sp. GSMTC-2017]|uniref:MFS transporter n=1 Tax=Paenibacillus sp. GSMTC-2017 TaxID=2794350 RepID=UPI0018D98198|nr:MFS transporter [Paenibacillus sp. GSMTC-2017]MBH5320364.1 MFS transporter [Paenibacillus sp. GSMTC-2017]
MTDKWKIYTLAIICFLVGTSEYIIAGILDQVALDIGVTVAAAGQLITVYSLVFAFGTPIIMTLTATIDRRKMLIYSLITFIIGNVIAVALPGFIFLIVSRIILALSTGVFVVTAMTVTSKLAPADKQGSAIATLVMGFSTALIIGVPLGRVFAASYDWKLIFGVIGLLGIIATFVVIASIPRTASEAPIPLRDQFALLLQPKIAVAFSVTFFWIAGYSIVYTYISPYLSTITNMSSQVVSAGLFALGIASLLGSKFGGFSVDKWGAPRTLTIGMLLHVVALLAFSLAGQNVYLVFALLILWSFSAWSSGPTQQYYLLTLAPGASGIMLSLNSSFIQLGMAAGAGLGGIVIQKASLSDVSWIGAIGVLIAVGAAVLSFRLSRTEQPKEAALSVAPQQIEST